MDLRPFSLGRLIELATEKNLVEFCYLDSGGVVLSVGGCPLAFAPEEASAFLRHLVRGWACASAETEPGRWSTLRVLQPEDPAAGARPAEPDRARPASPPAQRQGIASSEDYIDAVLSFAEEMQLIEGFDKDRKRGQVTLRTQATTTEMTYLETLEYLSDSILYELRSGSEAERYAPPQGGPEVLTQG